MWWLRPPSGCSHPAEWGLNTFSPRHPLPSAWHTAVTVHEKCSVNEGGWFVTVQSISGAVASRGWQWRGSWVFIIVTTGLSDLQIGVRPWCTELRICRTRPGLHVQLASSQCMTSDPHLASSADWRRFPGALWEDPCHLLGLEGLCTRCEAVEDASVTDQTGNTRAAHVLWNEARSVCPACVQPIHHLWSPFSSAGAKLGIVLHPVMWVQLFSFLKSDHLERSVLFQRQTLFLLPAQGEVCSLFLTLREILVGKPYHARLQRVN